MTSRLDNRISRLEQQTVPVAAPSPDGGQISEWVRLISDRETEEELQTRIAKVRKERPGVGILVRRVVDPPLYN